MTHRKPDPAAGPDKRPINEVLAALATERRRLPRHGPGASTAIVVVDMQMNFLTPETTVSRSALDCTIRLLNSARGVGAPVFLIAVQHETQAQISHTWRLRPARVALLGPDNPEAALHPQLGQTETDRVLIKHHASAFAGTSLDSELRAAEVDTILLAGTSTSGCIRATAVDGAALLYRIMLVEDCVFDRRLLSGSVALHDIASRYADVIALDDAISIASRSARARAPL